jgi:hypothetical protein
MSLPTDFKYVRVQNLQQHKGVVVEDGQGIPRFSMGPLQSETKDLKDVQLNSGWIDQALILLRQGDIQVLLEGEELSAIELAALKYVGGVVLIRDLIPAGDVLFIGTTRQYAVYGNFTVHGTVVVNGKLVVH